MPKRILIICCIGWHGTSSSLLSSSFLSSTFPTLATVTVAKKGNGDLSPLASQRSAAQLGRRKGPYITAGFLKGRVDKTEVGRNELISSSVLSLSDDISPTTQRVAFTSFASSVKVQNRKYRTYCPRFNPPEMNHIGRKTIYPTKLNK